LEKGGTAGKKRGKRRSRAELKIEMGENCTTLVVESSKKEPKKNRKKH